MPIEFEAKFPSIDIPAIRARLTSVGYICTKPRTLMTRTTLHKTDRNGIHEWWRVRDEGGGTITLTYKRADADTLDGTQEIETTVGHYQATVDLLQTTGLKVAAVQETAREIWQRDGIIACIDEWPGLKPFIEVEGADARIVTAACAELGFDMNQALFGPVGAVYELECGLKPDHVNNLPVITFAHPPTPRYCADRDK